jgi:hypothetical protein
LYIVSKSQNLSFSFFLASFLLLHPILPFQKFHLLFFFHFFFIFLFSPSSFLWGIHRFLSVALGKLEEKKKKEAIAIWQPGDTGASYSLTALLTTAKKRASTRL